MWATPRRWPSSEFLPHPYTPHGTSVEETTEILTLTYSPWSTTHEQLSDEEKTTSGATEDLIRISVGTEHIDDIIADFEQSFKARAEAAEAPKAEVVVPTAE